MAYNEVWDETFPPDTQLASQLGSDIRLFKTDIRQRVASFGAGSLSARPTPEAVFAGVMYYATDVDQLFQWTGVAWVLVKNFNNGSTVKVFSDLTTPTIVNHVGDTTGNQVVIPLLNYNPGTTLIEFKAFFTTVSVPTQIGLKLGASVLANVAGISGSGNGFFDWSLAITGANAETQWGITYNNGLISSITASAALTEPTSGSLTLQSYVVGNSNLAGSVKFLGLIAKVIY